MNQQISSILNTVLSTPLYKAILFILASIIVAKISDIIFTSLLRKMAGKTKTSIDDYIIDKIHKPIYYTILFIGFGLSISLFNLSDHIQFLLMGFLKTAIVIIWGSAIFKSFIYRRRMESLWNSTVAWMGTYI